MNVHEICEHVYHLLRAEARAGDPHRARLRSEPAERHARPAPAHPGAAQRRAQRAAGARRAAAASCCARARAATSASARCAIAWWQASQVEDNGPGVPEELRSSIFYPLVTGRPNGTGLGLAVAQDLVTRHGGIIEFESEPRPHRIHAAAAPAEELMSADRTACLAGRRRRLHPLGARARAAQRRHERRGHSRRRSRRWKRCGANRPTC